MCILDFIANASSSKSITEKYQKYVMHKYKPNHVIYFNDNISMVEKGKMRDSMRDDKLISSFMFDRKKDFDAKTATFDFSSDDRERSSAEEDDDGTCTLCTSSFSFCNTSQKSIKYSFD